MYNGYKYINYKSENSKKISNFFTLKSKLFILILIFLIIVINNKKENINKKMKGIYVKSKVF